MAGVFWQNVLHNRKERVYRHQNNPFDSLTDGELYGRYRFDRVGIDYLEELIGDNISRATKRSNALTERQQICTALRFFASGSFQEVSIRQKLEVTVQ